MLATAGIATAEHLRAAGAAAAFVAVSEAGHSPSRNLLWSLHGAIHGIDWRNLDDESKRRLLDEVAELTEPAE